jgi:hypothetical protein
LTDGNATTNKTDVEELNVLSESQPSLPATLDESFANVSTLTSDTHATRGTVSLLSVPPQGLKQRAYLRPPDRQLLPLLSPFVESQADAAGLVDLFRMILDDNFATNLQVWVSLAMSPLQDDEVCLGWLLEVSNCWICEHAAKEVNELPPPVRSKLVLVNQNDGDDDHGGQRVNTFTLRRESLKLKAVLHSFLKMWWRFPTTAFDALKAKIETYYKRPDRALSVTTLCPVVQDFLESSVIGALFLPIHQGNPEILPNKMGLGLLFSMVVLFRVKGDGTVAMYEAGWAATRLSDFLHILRAAACAYMVGMWDFWEGEEAATMSCSDIAAGLNRTRLWAKVMQWIRKLRTIQDKKGKLTAEWVDVEGNIYVGELHFRHSRWCRLIPSMMAMVEHYLGQLCPADSSWRLFLDVDR